MKFGSVLSPELRERHGRRSVRPRVGDTVKIMRGEFNNVEGKVTKVIASEGTLNIEGVTHEKIAGGNAPIPIHSSNVMVTSLNMSDRLRKKKLEGES